MKRALCLLTAVIMVLPLCACAGNNDNIRKPVNFYYCTDPENYDSQTGVISPEKRESVNYTGDLLGLLTLYLSGPVSGDLINPYPANVSMVGLSVEKTTVQITLSPEFLKLTGVDLTVACACMSMTVLELTNAQEITITVRDSLGDNQFTITISPEDLLLLNTIS